MRYEKQNIFLCTNTNQNDKYLFLYDKSVKKKNKIGDLHWNRTYCHSIRRIAILCSVKYSTERKV